MTQARRHRARGVLTPEGLLVDGTVVVGSDGTIVEVRRATADDPAPLDGWLLPGLVNAHLHLEFAAQGLVPSGGGFMGWGQRLMACRAPLDADAEAASARAMRDAGIAGVFDISNGGHTADALLAAGLRGVVQHELTGWGNKPDLEQRLRRMAEPPSGEGVVVRPGPHAVYSTGPAMLKASMAPRGDVPVSLHLGEDHGEVELVRDLEGPFTDWLLGLGIPEDELAVFGRGQGLVAYLDDLGVLHDRVLLVHGVQLDRDEHQVLAERGVSVCLCPRSNQHILGELPDVGSMVRAGVPLALGTDSLSSSPDLDLFGEIQLLVDAFPEVAPITWLHAATAGGARALRRHDLGRLEIGARPGLLLLEGLGDPSELVERPPVRWLEPLEAP